MIMSSSLAMEFSFMGLFRELSKKIFHFKQDSFDHPFKWFKESNFFVKVLRERRQFLKAYNISPQPISHCYETSLESLMAKVY